MAISRNLVIVQGNLGIDPKDETKEGSTKKKASGFLLQNYSYPSKGEDGKSNWAKATRAVPFICWGAVATRLLEWGSKGQHIEIEGTVELNTWIKDGKKRSRVVITAQYIQYTKMLDTLGPDQYADGSKINPDDIPY